MINKTQMQWMFLALAFFATATAQAEHDNWNSVIFLAERSIYKADKPEDVERSKVYYSKVGTRIEYGEGLNKNITIVNYQQQKCWLVQPEQKVYYEVAFHPKTKQCDKLDIAGFRPETNFPGVFSPRPCFGFKGIKVLGEENVMGRRTSKWQCLGDAHGATVQHWFDLSLHMVVRDVSGNKVSEATKVALSRKLDSSLLQPPTEYTLKK